MYSVKEFVQCHLKFFSQGYLGYLFKSSVLFAVWDICVEQVSNEKSSQFFFCIKFIYKIIIFTYITKYTIIL